MTKGSLREKKYARTKVALMNAFMERLKKDRFDAISIRDICREVEVAEGTFFNYFPEKIDVIAYYLQLLMAKMIWKAGKDVTSGKYLPLINSVFDQMAEELVNTNVIYQILSAIMALSERPKRVEITALEKELVFPNEPGIGEAPSEMLDAWFAKCLAAARKNGELPARTNINDVQVSLVTILAGTLMAVRFGDVKSRGYHYRRQLKVLWDSVGAKI